MLQVQMQVPVCTGNSFEERRSSIQSKRDIEDIQLDDFDVNMRLEACLHLRGDLQTTGGPQVLPILRERSEDAQEEPVAAFPSQVLTNIACVFFLQDCTDRRVQHRH